MGKDHIVGSFRLVLDCECVDESELIELQGNDPSEFFEFLEREGSGKLATLWEGEKRLGTLKRTEPGLWQLTH